MDSIIKPRLPHEFVLKSPKFIKIDTISIINSYFSNEVLEKNAKEPGFIELTKIKGNIYNLTNSTKAIEKDEHTSFLANAYFMDKSLLTASFHFPLNSKNGEYYYEGELDTFNVQELNPLLENSFFVSVVSGTINSLNFDIVANDQDAEGELQMNYKNLKIDLLNKKKTDSLVIDKRGLFSMVANSVIRNNNPNIGGFFKKGKVYYEPNKYKSVYNYWISSILSGMKSTLGFKSKQWKERLKITKIENKSEQKTKRRTAKKDRKQKRINKKQFNKEMKLEHRLRKKNERNERKGRNDLKQLSVNSFFSARRIYANQ
jgi:hypothetical protein